MSHQNGTNSPRGALSLLRDSHGNIMPMAAIAMIAMAGMVGGGVDISRGYMVENRLQNACDAGVLAGRRAVGENGFDTAAKTQADNYFYTNFDEAGEGTRATAFTPVAVEDGNRINGTASTTMDTAVMKLFGFDNINLAVTCSASMSVGNSDVVMVLDTTGSMGNNLGGQTRIASLRAAMKSFYDTVAAASAGGNSRIRYGFVPYSSSINVGKLVYAVNNDYIADTMTVQSLVPEYDEVEVNEFSGWADPVYSSDSNYSYGEIEVFSWTNHSGSYRKKKDCNNAVPNSSSWVNSGSTDTTSNETTNSAGQKVVTTTTSQTQTRSSYRCIKEAKKKFWVQVQTQARERFSNDYAISDPEYTTTTTTEFANYLHKEIQNFDVSAYKTGNPTDAMTGAGGTMETWQWEGCIEERATVSVDDFTFNSLAGITPAAATDLDIDTPPNTSNEATKWKPMWPEVSYVRGYLNSWGSFRTSNATESEVGRRASYTCPKEAQLLEKMDESDFDAYADSLTPSGNTYHDIGMLWGARLASPTGIFQTNVTKAPSNGGSVARHIIFMTDGEMVPNRSILTTYGIERYDQRVTDNGQSEHADRHRARFLAICQATKAKGIRVWVIAFGSALTTNLESCASTDSAFLANNASQLNEAFQEIAKNVGELRVVQ